MATENLEIAEVIKDIQTDLKDADAAVNTRGMRKLARLVELTEAYQPIFIRWDRTRSAQ